MTTYDPSKAEAGNIINYARLIVMRVDPKVGKLARETLLNECDHREELHERLRREFDRHFARPDTGVLASPYFVGDMRAKTLMSLAYVADKKQAGFMRNRFVTPTDQSALDWADNPNGFRRLGDYLAIAAFINARAATENKAIGLEEVAKTAHDYAAHRPGMARIARTSIPLLPGPRH